MKQMLIVQTTFADRQEAVELASKLLKERLIACAQISDQIQSFYWWKGAIEKSDEYILSVKTHTEKYPQLEKYISEMHSYETPEILAIGVEKVSSEYLQWLKDEIQLQ